MKKFIALLIMGVVAVSTAQAGDVYAVVGAEFSEPFGDLRFDDESDLTYRAGAQYQTDGGLVFGAEAFKTDIEGTAKNEKGLRLQVEFRPCLTC